MKQKHEMVFVKRMKQKTRNSFCKMHETKSTKQFFVKRMKQKHETVFVKHMKHKTRNSFCKTYEI